MFGYVRILKEDLKIREYVKFRAYYCGLCKQLGKSFNQLVRLGLNYDMVFLAVLLDSLTKENSQPVISKCMLHPLQKHPIIYNNTALEYASAMSVLLMNAKTQDDIDDEGYNPKNITFKTIYSSSAKKAMKNNEYAIINHHITACLNEMSALEKQKCAVIDEIADKFGNMMKVLFAPSFVGDNNTRETLKQLGYLMGRWIYILDAYDDIENDIKSNSYNPILLQYNYKDGENPQDFIDRINEKVSFTLDFTLSQIAINADELKFLDNNEVLFNIFYFGMPNKQRQVFEKRDPIKDENSHINI